MYDEYVHSDGSGQSHEFLLEDMMQARVGSPSVTKQADGVCIWVLPLQVLSPYPCNVVADEFGSVVTGADGQISGVRSYVIDDMGDNLTVSKRQEVMVESLWMPLADDLPGTLEVANHLMLFGIDAEHRNSLAEALLRKGVYLPELRVPVLVVLQRPGLEKERFLKPRTATIWRT